MPFISQALAADTAPTPAVTTAPEPVVSGTTAATQDGAPVTPPNATTNLTQQIGFFLLLFVLFYVLMIRPQQKRMKEQQSLMTGLAQGDKVVTNGGIIGTITAIPNDHEIELEIAPGTKVTVLRYSVYKKYDANDYVVKKTK